MILIGMYDSPFVRRVAIAMRLYGFPFEHRSWSVFGDVEKVAKFNPLRRVPTLVLDDGETLIESAIILDYLDEQAGAPLVAARGEARRAALKICALATGMADKGINLIIERLLHNNSSEVWMNRCRTQIAEVLDLLDADRAKRTTLYWFGDAINHADIAVACALQFLKESQPGLLDLARWPALAKHARHCEEMAVFQEIYRPWSAGPPRA